MQQVHLFYHRIHDIISYCYAFTSNYVFREVVFLIVTIVTLIRGKKKKNEVVCLSEIAICLWLKNQVSDPHGRSLIVFLRDPRPATCPFWKLNLWSGFEDYTVVSRLSGPRLSGIRIIRTCKNESWSSGFWINRISPDYPDSSEPRM